MSNPAKSIAFPCSQHLFERIDEASRRTGISVEKYVSQVVEDHFFPATKRRRDYYTPRCFYTYEIDPD